MLLGTIYITDNDQIIYQANLANTKIINLDEDGTLMENPAFIGGTCLLPPIDAKIAEADGNEQLYDSIYSQHLNMPFQKEFIAALIAYLYRGGNLLLYLPELGYDNTTNKLIFHMYALYGIHIGIIGNPNPAIANCYYDNSCIPIWLNMIYAANVITPYEYLFKYPLDAQLPVNGPIMNKLICDIMPFADTLQDKINYILRLHQLIHKNPKAIPAIESEF